MVSIKFRCLNIFMLTYFTAFLVGHIYLDYVNIGVIETLVHTRKIETKTGLDTNGCPLGSSKFILLSDNLNICLWLSACQVEKMYQIGLISES